MYRDDHSAIGTMSMTSSPESVVTPTPKLGMQDFFAEFKEELLKGVNKYGLEDETIPFIQSIDKNFELGAVAKYISRISRGDARAKEDCVKAATYLYFYWLRLNNTDRERSL